MDDLSNRVRDIPEKHIDLPDDDDEKWPSRVRLYLGTYPEPHITLQLTKSRETAELTVAQARDLASMLLDIAHGLEREIKNTCEICGYEKLAYQKHHCPPKFECNAIGFTDLNQTIYASDIEEVLDCFMDEVPGDVNERDLVIEIRAEDGTVTQWKRGPEFVQAQ